MSLKYEHASEPLLVNPTPYTLHPTPSTLHPTPYTLHPTPGVPYRGASLIRNCPPPQDHCRSLGIGLMKGPRGLLFLMSEVPLYTTP